jgi:hypothetical protein
MGLFKRFNDASDELAWHLEQRVQQYIREGMTEADAKAAARRQIGNLTAITEETAESGVFICFETFKREILLALRMLRRAPTVAAVAILSLGLGIGANTVVFTLMKQVVLDYLPVPEPERLVILHNQNPEYGHEWNDGMNSSFSYPMYRDLNAASGRIFEGILAFRAVDISLSGRQSAESITGGMVSGNFLSGAASLSLARPLVHRR